MTFILLTLMWCWSRATGRTKDSWLTWMLADHGDCDYGPEDIPGI